MTRTGTPTRQPKSVTELIAGELYAIGATVEADRPSTWIAPGVTGRMAVSCYLLRDGADALLVDTGIGAHRDAIGRGLRALIKPSLRTSLVTTRREPDAIGNLPFVLRHFPIRTVYCGGLLSPVDFFERIDKLSTEAHLHAVAGRDVTWVNPGDAIQVGRRPVDVLRTLIAVLPKSHLFDGATGTLFGSDTWSFVPQAKDGRLGIVRDIGPALSRERIADYFTHRLDWMLGANTAPLCEEVEGLRDRRRPERILSSFGCAIEGARTVSHVLAETLAALETLAKAPRYNRLRGFSEAAFANALNGPPTIGL